MNSEDNALFQCNGGGAVQNIYIHQMIIQTDVTGVNQVKIKLSPGQKIRALLRLGPSEKELEAKMTKLLFGEKK